MVLKDLELSISLLFSQDIIKKDFLLLGFMEEMYRMQMIIPFPRM